MGDGLSSINPDDIADIQVLKGAAASALYGYRGGNGAISVSYTHLNEELFQARITRIDAVLVILFLKTVYSV